MVWAVRQAAGGVVGSDGGQRVYTGMLLILLSSGAHLAWWRRGGPPSLCQVGSEPAPYVSRRGSCPRLSRCSPCGCLAAVLCGALSLALGTCGGGPAAAVLAETAVSINYTAVWREFYQGCVGGVTRAWEVGVEGSGVGHQ